MPETLTDLFRHHDPQRGPFDPTLREPAGARHIDKTYQDQLPRDKRPRVQEAAKRLEQRRAGC